MGFVCKFDYRIDLNCFKSRLFLYRHKLGTNKFDDVTAVENDVILLIFYDTAAKSFIPGETLSFGPSRKLSY